MASNLSSIGFVFASADEFQQTMLRLAAQAVERLGCAAGDYSIWRSPTGAEIWFHLTVFGTEDNASDIAGLTPFFEGSSEIALDITQRFQRPDDNAFEGAFAARVVGGVHAADNRVFVLDAVDFAAHVDRPVPFRCRARITGFARTLRVHRDITALAAPHAFIPLDQPPGSSSSKPQVSSAALLIGRVGEHHVLVNEVTDQRFHWLLLDCGTATFDIVADPEAVQGEIAVGGTVEVDCLLLGRLLGA